MLLSYLALTEIGSRAAVQDSNQLPLTAAGPERPVYRRSVKDGVPINVNGAMISGVRIDTNPNVLALGADLGAGRILTVVIDRTALPYLNLEFGNRPNDS